MLEAIEYIKSIINDYEPETGIVLGSGLGELADEVGGKRIPYCEIPGFENSTVQGHKGSLVFAEIDGKKCVFMQGRYHFYEGHNLQKVTFPIRILKKLGIKNLILTNAAGGINSNFQSGDLMLITDHINLMGTNPLIGMNDDLIGPRFPDMSETYKKRLRDIAQEVAMSLNIELKQGVYVASTGPSYETPAEIKMLKIMGADACGMSTVPEAIVANHAGINVLGISCITNMAAGIQNTPLNHEEVVETANRVKSNFKNLLINLIKNI